jgi:hypothetical protein
MDVKPYPLCWPLAQPRTRVRMRSRFGGKQGRWTFGRARDDLLDEIERLHASHTVLSTNVRLRLDGIPYANEREPDDPGVAVYFRRKGKPFVIACDTYDRIADNCRAIMLTIAALRSIERHGSSSLLEQAFSGFSALPPARTGIRPWREVLGVGEGLLSLVFAEARFRELASRHHPDRGGSHERMAEINDAIRRAREELS